MDGVGAVAAGGVEDAVDAEVAFGGGAGADVGGFIGHADVERGAVGVGEDGDAGDAHFAEGADDADGDLAAIGDQDLAEHADGIVAGVGGGFEGVDSTQRRRERRGSAEKNTEDRRANRRWHWHLFQQGSFWFLCAYLCVLCVSAVKIIFPFRRRAGAGRIGGFSGYAMALDSIKGSLKERGVRLTRQRQILLELIDKTGEHLDAERLFQLAKEKDPKLNRVTVYRTLKMLKAAVWWTSWT